MISRCSNLAQESDILVCLGGFTLLGFWQRGKAVQQAKEKNKAEKPKHAKRNAAGVQMLSRSLHEQIFKNCTFPSPPKTYTNISLEHLSAHGLDPTQSSTLPSTEFTLPPLQGNNLLEHFYRIGVSSSEPYISLAKEFSETELPPIPDDWQLQAGWTKYHHSPDGSGYCEARPFSCSRRRIRVVARIRRRNYAQIPQISHLSMCGFTRCLLLDTTSRTIVVVSRRNILWQAPKNRFMDTMSLHVAIKGISSHQRPAWMKYRKEKQDAIDSRDEAIEAVVHLLHDVEQQLDGLRQAIASGVMTTGEKFKSCSIETSQKRWEDITSGNSLVDVAKLHCNIDISKEIRNDFMTSTPADILDGIHDYITYCATDVDTTHAVYRKVLPEFLQACPHPVSFAGVATMGTGFLPVNEQWEAYIDRAERVWQAMEGKVRAGLENLTRAAVKDYQVSSLDTPVTGPWQDDVWLSQMDWTPKVAGKSRGIYPFGEQPTNSDEETETETASSETFPSWFYKLPHKDGESANVGSPLSKSFLKFAMDGVLKSSAGDELKELVDVGAQCSYWISARDRILNQVVIWDDKTSASSSMGFPPNATEQSAEELETQQKELTEISAALGLGFAETPRAKKWGIILPQVITMGTVTRRAIEKTWLTASNAKKNRVGSELKSMVRAPPGYAIVGADVDSEELWISSCMGDAQFGMHGATAIGWMTLEGTKAAGTDLHSKTASILGISRDQAKVFNYSRIYGKNTHRNDIFDRKFWYGGTESYLFNKLEEIALSEKPQTPALGCGVTHALQKDCLPAGFGSDYMPSRINWLYSPPASTTSTSSLYPWITLFESTISALDILISVHDELRYLVKERRPFQGSASTTNCQPLDTKYVCIQARVDDLPQGVAFFSAVDVDKVLRKEVDMPCVTPSHPIPIPPGESLGIGDVLTRTNGGSLWADGKPMELNNNSASWEGSLDGYSEVDCLTHRANNAAFLRAQATSDFSEVKHLARQVQGKKFEGRPGSRGDPSKTKKKSKNGKSIPVGNGEGVDWQRFVERLLREGRELMSSSILHAKQAQPEQAQPQPALFPTQGATSFHVITPRRTLAEIAKEERKKKEAEEAKAEAEKDKLKAEKKKKAAEKARLAEERAAREERAALGLNARRSSDSESDEHSDQEKDTSRQGSQSKKRKLEVRKGKSRKPKQVKAKEVDFED
ncbi:DNA/RNA polymerase [Gymnopus androsaceus JB14]|uniref:Mitochondrial DNA polymerase catalytic subunit n=1 Tax=Gymnopus androsaceus JB14 TaxID=1447944 RepID=A0A6A4H4R6_9AGAR|nr:DNA/RNA polymerase [Gymnopus androsaceus JB14]